MTPCGLSCWLIDVFFLVPAHLLMSLRFNATKALSVNRFNELTSEQKEKKSVMEAGVAPVAADASREELMRSNAA